MPVVRCQDNGRPGFRWGSRGTCYTYTPGDAESRRRAIRKAQAQGFAAGGRGDELAVREAHLRPSAETQARYQRELEAAIRRIGRLEPAARRVAEAHLRAYQQQVVRILRDEIDRGTESVNLWNEARRRLADATARFVDDTTTAARPVAEDAWEAGQDLARAGLADLGAGARGIPRDLFETAFETVPRLIGGAADNHLNRIRFEVVAVTMGAQTTEDAIRNIGANLTSTNHFRSLRARAEAILITETNRIQAVATQREQERLADVEPALRKRWLNAHTANPRPEHIEAETRYSPDGEIGPIPIDAEYSVGGERALFPRAPNLSARNTVHCRCVSVTVLPDILEPDPDLTARG